MLKSRDVVLAAGLVGALFGTAGISSAHAGNADTYEGTISIRNNTGTVFVVSGCSADKKDHNRCSLTTTPVILQPGDVKAIGDVNNTSHSATGKFTLNVQGISDHFYLKYALDKHVSESSFSIDDSELGYSAFVDTTLCDRSPNAQGTMKCCTYTKKHVHKLFWEYKYDCEIPITMSME
ncbi:hypothetical protein [Parendozoicomonas haliclonae]|uniref:Uncharacterized protein n=1 Tax=Parendozoicomonas haliclonae TaxID=1960125 RepID=A0A1X7ADR7_9GAMM|nr:hypothetical protein [Parendozoicomonas haliclonae]SMA32581.1 hypothetical protein EHSB41UT_00165 [Parendozoicomonas haliclonae]